MCGGGDNSTEYLNLMHACVEHNERVCDYENLPVISGPHCLLFIEVRFPTRGHSDQPAADN